ncbi:hypothetical protein OZY43_07670 [Lactobacillus sp. ESL0785]|uniref:hypothetical protein n=1 Tax=Lactobacillus sp. ESL0785 TaxID=2983232 RepID=UPI0023F793A6|nr:hypothetical protein [Lactobacillus sp. ESL0785]WEV70804.1 hypothetical protein OZY43_07670 [Lactobacillus sp. ESL0785]
MKHSKLMTMLAAAAVIATTGAGLATTVQAKTVKVVKHSKTGSHSFPKKWDGKWYSSSILTPDPLVIKADSFNSLGAEETVKMTKVSDAASTGKATAQITNVKQDPSLAALNAAATGTKKKIGNTTWSIVKPAGKKTTDDTAFTMKVEKINGKKVQVLLEAQPDTGKVYNQYFRSKKLAKKYGNRHFKNISYTEINYR